MTIYFIRHGQTEYNIRGIVQGSGIDSELNEVGRQQAQAFYDYYKDVEFDLIIGSALQRTHQTLAPFVNNHPTIPFEKTALINEINWGVHEGQKYQPWMKGNYEKLIQEWNIGNFDASLEEGESARSLADRLQKFLDDLVQRKAKTVLVCTHGRTMRCMISLLKKQHLREMEKYRHHNTCLYKARWSDGAFTVELENDIRHLKSLDPAK